MRLAALAVLAVVTQEAGGTAAELRHVGRQLDELYGPMLLLVEESRVAVDDVLQKLGRPGIFPLDPEKKEEKDFWIFRAENDFMPRNERMCKIVRKRGHWAEGTELPPSFAALLEHQDSWRLLHARWKKEGVAYSWGSRTPFPRPLLAEMRRAFKSLRARQDDLLKADPAGQLRQVERQIDELYGPLVTLNHEARLSHGNLLAAIGRDAVFPLDEKKRDDELRRWLFWIESAFLPLNEKRRKLLEEKSALLEGAELSADLKRFLGLANAWRVDHLRWQKEKVEYRWDAREVEAAGFTAEIEGGLKRLKERHAALLKK
jgi:hypothetical protein